MLPPERPTTEPEADEPTDWQREMAVEIKREIECPTSTCCYTLEEASSVVGNRIVTRILHEVRPEFLMMVARRADRLPDHIPLSVRVDIEKELPGEVLQFTVECEWIKGALGENFATHTYKCSVIE